MYIYIYIYIYTHYSLSNKYDSIGEAGGDGEEFGWAHAHGHLAAEVRIPARPRGFTGLYPLPFRFP